MDSWNIDCCWGKVGFPRPFSGGGLDWNLWRISDRDVTIGALLKHRRMKCKGQGRGSHYPDIINLDAIKTKISRVRLFECICTLIRGYKSENFEFVNMTNQSGCVTKYCKFLQVFWSKFVIVLFEDYCLSTWPICHFYGPSWQFWKFTLFKSVIWIWKIFL